MTGARTVGAGLFASVDPPRLAGSQCPECATVVFPVQDGCPRCSYRPLAPVELPSRGTVWSWTTQQFAPKSPFRPPVGGWAPLAIGYVDLGDVLVEGWLVPADHDWRIGDEVELTTVGAYHDDEGDVVTYAFLAVGS